MEVRAFKTSISNELFRRLDEAVNTARVVRNGRTFANYERTDRLGTFTPRVKFRDNIHRVSALGNRFVRLVDSSIAQVRCFSRFD